MFSFRTTSIADQLDKALVDGKVGLFCSQSCWEASSGLYLWDIFRARGNLSALFVPAEGEDHIDFDLDAIAGLNAVVVDVQDNGTRWCNYSTDVFRLMNALRALGEEAPSLYVVDHENPAGRIVEGTIPAIDCDEWTPKVAHRHGLTLGELCHLYHNEISAQYALHIISARAGSRQILPWAIPASGDMPGMFTPMMASGGGLWHGTSICAGTGTLRPYEMIGAPFLAPQDGLPSGPCDAPAPEGVLMRPCTFTPSSGQYEGMLCGGWQILLTPGAEYHSILHTLNLMGYMRYRYPQFTMSEETFARIADPVIATYLKGGITFDIVEEHIKGEEQKWIRKAKRYVLYDDQPVRIK